MAAPTTRNALFPFGPNANDDNPPDIIVRSSDLIDFHVHKSLLSFSSPFFRNMFAFPEPTGANANPKMNGMSVVDLPESGDAVRLVLALIYPGVFTGTPTLDGFVEAYDAARKYDIASGELVLSAILDDSRLLTTSPHRLFVIACRLNKEDIAKRAAQETLKLPRTAYISPPPPEFKLLPGHQVWKLYDFQYTAAEALQKTLASFSNRAFEFDKGERFEHVWWLSEGHSERCGPSDEEDPMDSLTYTLPAQWFREHITRIQELCLIRPDPSWIAQRLVEFSAPTMADVARCPKCMVNAALDLKETAERFEVIGQRRVEALGKLNYVFTSA
ncbi:hypothetical protein C8F01DRAFT_268920 [Mycena amicta]|nr:hypothetical protein C8F01DRAFT_268920 [Mycena amicta]